MEQTEMEQMLNLMLGPVFLVKDRTITYVNEAASRLLLREGIAVETLLESGAEEYSNFESGMLYVTLSIFGQPWGASVTRLNGYDVFTLDKLTESAELQALALAAMELRGPLSNILLAANQLHASEEDAKSLHFLNRGLSQLNRLVSNMSDASGVNAVSGKQIQDIDALFRECVEKAGALAESGGIRIRYSGLKQELLCWVDWQQLERAALNMISNAIKFSEPGAAIQISLNAVGSLLRFSVTDSGCGIDDRLKSTLFQRYRREPVIEDSRHGLGLGMLMIRNAAASHAGAVLIDRCADGGTRVTLTISTALPAETELHTPLLNVDYAGENDHALLELSDCLPAELY